MSMVMKLFLSMSCSGGLLILILLLGKRALRDRISRQWQYYIWLVVVLRLLLPFGPQVSLLGKTYQAVDQAIVRAQQLSQPSAPLSTQPAPQQPGALVQPPASLTLPWPDSDTLGGGSVSAGGLAQESGDADSLADDLEAVHPLQDIGKMLIDHIWLVWLVGALGLLIRKITIYQSFVRYINIGSVPVSDMETLDRLSITAKQAGVKKPVELCVNPLISSPLLIGFFHPCIVVPGADISEKDFSYIILHELTHYKRGDMFYKWLVQITVCLHWFNPLVYLMSREIAWACEFSCDEAVLAKMGGGSAQDYGKTLLDAMAAVGRFRENPGAVTLGQNKQLLKERLEALMKYRQRSKTAKILTAVITVCVALGAAFLGIYTIGTAAESGQAVSLFDRLADAGGILSDTIGTLSGKIDIGPDTNGVSSETTDTLSGKIEEPSDTTDTQPSTGDTLPEVMGTPTSITSIPFPGSDGRPDITNAAPLDIEQAYEAGSLPLFQIAFTHLDQVAQGRWMEQIYGDDQIAFWGAAVELLDKDCPLIRHYAEKTYEADSIAYFSSLAMHMSEYTLEEWLDRALEDGKWNFQSMLFHLLGRGDESDELEEKWEKEWEEAQTAEYEAAGITMDGKDYYYQAQLVHIFLDIRANQSFYTLDINPAGNVNIKIIRDGDDKITGVAYMTQAEAAELLEDMGDEEEDEDHGQEARGGRIWHPQVIPVNLEAMAEGEIVWLGEYALTHGDRIWYAVTAEIGEGLQVGFVKSGNESLNQVYYSVHSLRQEGEALECIASIKFADPVEPGTYRLFLRSPDSALENVRGSISIGFEAEAETY